MKAIITTLLLLGTSTAALADSPTYGQSYQQHDSRRFDGDDRYDGRFDDQDGRFSDRRGWFRRPVMLAQNVTLYRQWNQQQRPLLVNLDARTQRVSKLRLDRNEGRMFVSAVVVNYADGHQQTLRVNQMLSAREPSISIDLEHGGATSMYVYGSPMRGGRATFDVIGLRR